jgi:hypothetical protein
MIRQWQEYQARPRTVNRDGAHASLSKDGILALNRIAHQQMGSPDAVVLLYDPRYKVIGLRPAGLDRENAFPLRQRYKSGRNAGRGMLAVYATGFFKLHDLKPACTLAFDNPRFESGVLELELKSARELTR